MLLEILLYVSMQLQILGPRRGRFHDVETGEELAVPKEIPGHNVSLQVRVVTHRKQKTYNMFPCPTLLEHIMTYTLTHTLLVFDTDAWYYDLVVWMVRI